MATKTIKDKKAQKRKKTSTPERYGYIEDVRFGALIALGVSGYPHTVMFDPDMNPELVRFIRSFGTIEQDDALHECQWIARWTALSDNEATLVEIARVGKGPADYRLLSRDERHKWYVQAIQIMHDYGIAAVAGMQSVLAWSLNCDLNDHMRRDETLQDATYRLHFQCSKIATQKREEGEKKLAAHAPGGTEHSDDLNEWFPREGKGQVMQQYPDWIDKADAYLYAIPNHIKRDLNLDASEVGWHVRKCYDMPLDVFVTQHGTRAAYDKCVQYCTEVLAWRQENETIDTTHNEAPADATEGEQLARLVDKEKRMQYPESPVVVFPQGNGSVNYKGIKFSVTLRIGGTFAQAVPLMDEYVTALAMEIIELARSCLVSPAAPQHSPAQSAPAAQQAAPASNGSGMKYERVNRVSCDVTNGITTYSLWGANAKLQWPLWKLGSATQRDGEHISQLLDALNAQGIQGLSGGVSASVDLKVYWTPSENLNKNNQPYKDIAQIVAEVPEKSEVPF